MKSWKKTFPFLLLNIVVSAATMLTVLWFWQQRNPLPETKASFTPAVTQAAVPSQRVIEQPSEPSKAAPSGLLDIEGVFGAGDLNVEYVLIRNQSDVSVNLDGWSVASSTGEVYALPLLNLNKNGAVRLYSKHGTNTVIELYWNSDQSLWASGSQVNLIDQSGQQQATWQVP